MEKILLYAYLNYMKENKITFWPKLLKLPKHILVLLALAIVCILGVLLCSVFRQPLWSWAFIAGELVFGIIAFYCLDRYQIQTAKMSFSEYKDYCKDIEKWLIEYDLKTADDIEKMRIRLETNLSEMKTEYEKRNERLFKWTQTLIIPIILAVITAVIAKQSEFESIIAYASALLFAFAALYGVFVVFRNILAFPVKQKIEQMECLISDLQGVLDFKK